MRNQELNTYRIAPQRQLDIPAIPNAGNHILNNAPAQTDGKCLGRKPSHDFGRAIEQHTTFGNIEHHLDQVCMGLQEFPSVLPFFPQDRHAFFCLCCHYVSQLSGSILRGRFEEVRRRFACLKDSGRSQEASLDVKKARSEGQMYVLNRVDNWLSENLNNLCTMPFESRAQRRKSHSQREAAATGLYSYSDAHSEQLIMRQLCLGTTAVPANMCVLCLWFGPCHRPDPWPFWCCRWPSYEACGGSGRRTKQRSSNTHVCTW